MRKFLPISLLPFLLLSVFGFNISFFISRQIVRTEASEMLKQKKQIETSKFEFTFTEYQQLSKFDNENEFSIEGKIYDIASKKIVNGKVVLLACFDRAETNLLAEFVSSFQDEATSSTSDPLNIYSFPTFEFVIYSTNWKFINPLVVVPLVKPNFSLLTVSTEVHSPPPKFS